MTPKGIVQRAALMGAVFATAVIAIRAVFGPLQIGSVSLSSPLGPESLFAACLLLLVFLRAKNQFATQPSAPSRSQGWHVALLAAAVIAAFAPNLTAPFLSDDYILVQTPTLQMKQVWQWFALPGGDGSYRPLGSIAFAFGSAPIAASRSGLRPSVEATMCGLPALSIVKNAMSLDACARTEAANALSTIRTAMSVPATRFAPAPAIGTATA